MTSTPASPVPTPAKVRHVSRSSSHHAERGATQSGVENANTDARPGGSRVNATAVSAEYVAICRTPETATSRQSDGDGRLSSPRTATKPKPQTVATTYRRLANHTGGMADTPTLIAGQLAAHTMTRTTRSERPRASADIL